MVLTFPYNYNEGYETDNPLQYENYYGDARSNNRLYRSQRVMRNMRRYGYRNSAPVLRVADTCNPAVEDLVARKNLPDDSDVHVVMVDDPVILILPASNVTTTTCQSVLDFAK